MAHSTGCPDCGGALRVKQSRYDGRWGVGCDPCQRNFRMMDTKEQAQHVCDQMSGPATYSVKSVAIHVSDDRVRETYFDFKNCEAAGADGYPCPFPAAALARMASGRALHLCSSCAEWYRRRDLPGVKQ